MQGFVQFYCEKLLVARKREGGLIDPLGDRRCKTRWSWKFTKGSSTPSTPANSHPVVSWVQTSMLRSEDSRSHGHDVQRVGYSRFKRITRRSVVTLAGVEPLPLSADYVNDA